MKRKILSILLIIFMLSASLITIPVNAKILNDGDNSWTWDYDDVWQEPTIGGTAVYATLDEYLNSHYVDFENLDKSQIDTLYIIHTDRYPIEDLSGLYEFQNLKNLVILDPGETTQAAIEKLDFNRLTSLEKLDLEYVNISDLKIAQLTNLTFLQIYCEYYEYYDDLDLSSLNNLSYFSYNVVIPSNTNDVEGTAETIGSYITVPEGYEIDYFINYEAQGGIEIIYSLIEKLNVTVQTNKTNYTLGENVICNVSWDKTIEAAEFLLHFDYSKLEFIEADIGEDYYGDTDGVFGELSVAWAALDEQGINDINFTFKTIDKGEAEFQVAPFEFATGDLDNTFAYSGNTKNITINTDYIKEDAIIQTDFTNIDGFDYALISGLKLTDNKVTFQDLMDLDAFEEEITVKAYTCDGEDILSTEGLGTGSVIKLYKGEELVGEFDVIVYGDVSGDGEITALDALTIIKARNGKLGYSLSAICSAAGQVFTGHQAVQGPSAIDALAIIKHLNGKYEISQNY